MSFETAHTFSGDDGRHPPGALLLASDGDLYGTVYSGMLLPGAGSGGGNGAAGGIFRVTLGGQFSVVAPFDPALLGLPQTGLVEGPGGLLYGATTQGGTNGQGTVFASTTAGDVTVLHSFDGASGSGLFLVALLYSTRRKPSTA